MRILAIDPGNMESAFCIIDSETYKAEAFSKIENDRLLGFMQANSLQYDKVIIEMVASYRNGSRCNSI